jgi:hypothetical protein
MTSTKPEDFGQAKLYQDYEVIRAEHHEIEKRRGRPVVDVTSKVAALLRKPNNHTYTQTGIYDTIGLALSGGGIRSAAFCTGAMQALDAHGVLGKTAYMSSVSGGGYAAVAAGMGFIDDNKFPFYANEEQKDTPAMGALRDNASYLKTSKLETLRNLVVYLRGVATNFLILTPVLLLLAWITLLVNPDLEAMRMPDYLGLVIGDRFGSFTGTVYALLALLLVLCLWAVSTWSTTRAGVKTWLSTVMSVALVVVGLVAFFELQPFIVMQMVEGWRPVPPTAVLGTAEATPVTTGSVIVTRLIGFFTAVSAFLTLVSSSLSTFMKSDTEQSSILRAIKSFFRSRALWFMAAMVLPLTLWLVYLLLVYWGVDLSQLPVDQRPPRPVTASLRHAADWFLRGDIAALYFFCGVAMACLWFFLSANGNSPHRLYRDRLGDAFCFPHLANSKAEDPRRRSDTEIEALREVKKLSALAGKGPYQLINTALNIGGDELVNQRGRDADFFLFSQLFIGSKATSYAPTTRVEDLPGARRFDVASAMAVSGAAFSSNMGSATIKLLRLTLAFFNVRLGYWFPNPKRVNQEKMVPTFLYFLQEVLGNLKHDSHVVYLTDGGHVENLGIYELLRRRCELIIVIDAEADPKMTFGSYVRAQRYARIDLGAVMHLPWRRIAARSLLTQANQMKPDEPEVDKQGPHCAIGRIDYDRGGTGYLIYVKSSVTGDEKDYIKDYNARHLAFPHETTADQFFSEEQFEVYRALGFHAVNGVLDGTHVVETSDGLRKFSSNAPPDSIIAKVAEILLLAGSSLKAAATVSPAAAPDPAPSKRAKPQPRQRAPRLPGRNRKTPANR